MDAFQGRWESTGEVVGLDEYLEAVGRSDYKEAYLKKVIYDIKIDGDSITSVVEREGAPTTTHISKLGVRTEMTIPEFGVSYITVTHEGNKLVTKQEIAGGINEMTAQMEGDSLVWVSTANGKSMTSRMKKV